MRRRWNAITILAIVAILLLAGCTPAFRQPYTYRQALEMALDDRAIRYRDIQVFMNCQSQPSDCLEIGVVVVTATLPAAGWVQCQRYGGDCALWVPALEIQAVSLLPLTQDPGWLLTLKQYQRLID